MFFEINVEVAELQAGFEIIRFAIEAGFRAIELEGDNIVICIALKKKKVNLINGGILVVDIFLLVQSCFSSFVKNERNSIAHSLVRSGRNVYDDDVVCLEEPLLHCRRDVKL